MDFLKEEIMKKENINEEQYWHFIRGVIECIFYEKKEVVENIFKYYYSHDYSVLTGYSENVILGFRYIK